MELFAESDFLVDQEDLIIVSYTEDSFFRYHENAVQSHASSLVLKIQLLKCSAIFDQSVSFRIDFLLINHCK